MKLPSNVTEAEFLAAVERVAGVLAGKFRFGYHEPEDIVQLVWEYALQVVDKYDPSRGNIDGFVYRHCHNRISNLRRDQTGARNDPPCSVCHAATTGLGLGHPDGQVCPKYAEWRERNERRKAISSPMSFGGVNEGALAGWADSQPTAESAAVEHELADLIDRDLPPKLRTDYQRLLNGEGGEIPLHRRRRVQQAVFDILTEASVELDGFEALCERRFPSVKRKSKGEREQGTAPSAQDIHPEHGSTPPRPLQVDTDADE